MKNKLRKSIDKKFQAIVQIVKLIFAAKTYLYEKIRLKFVRSLQPGISIMFRSLLALV
jgi:hypothetical protein